MFPASSPWSGRVRRGISLLRHRRHGGGLLFLGVFATVALLTRTALLVREAREVAWDASLVAAALAALLRGAGLLATGLPAAWLEHAAEPASRRWAAAGIWTAVLLGLGLAVNQHQLPAFRNNYNRELAKDGLWSLFAAFRNNELDYEQFYRTRPERAVFERLHRELAEDGTAVARPGESDMLRHVRKIDPAVAHALIGNYEKLGHLEKGALMVLGPQQEAKTYHDEAGTGALVPMAPSAHAEEEALSYYQGASIVYQRGLYRAVTPEEGRRLTARLGAGDSARQPRGSL